jgi:hypothetical protein
VADFIGSSNLVKARVCGIGGKAHSVVETEGGPPSIPPLPMPPAQR